LTSEKLRDIPLQLMHCISRKEYLNATRLLTSGINASETKLKDIVGLQELKDDLNLKKQVGECSNVRLSETNCTEYNRENEW